MNYAGRCDRPPAGFPTGCKGLTQIGTYDWICNHIGNEMWMERLKWSGKEGYNEQKLADWKVDGKVAGKYKSYKNLSVSPLLVHDGN